MTTYRLHEVQINLTLTTQCRPNLTDQTGKEPNRHICKGQLLWNQYTDSKRGENLFTNLINFMYEIYTQNKDKIRHGRISFKNDTNAKIAHCHRSDRPIQSIKNYAYYSLGNLHLAGLPLHSSRPSLGDCHLFPKLYGRPFCTPEEVSQKINFLKKY